MSMVQFIQYHKCLTLCHATEVEVGELGKEAPPQQKKQKESQQMDEECFKKNWIIVEEPT